jgi:hypothetical protein
LVELLEVLEFAKVKPHAEFTNTERAILRNQRLLMVALAELMERATSGHLPTGNKLVDRVHDMERLWPWITLPGELVTEKPRDN